MSKCLILFVASIIFLCQLSLGTFQIMYVNKYKSYKNECSNLWIETVVTAVINILCPIFSFRVLNSYKNTDVFDFNTLIKIQLCQLISGIWSAIIFFNISEFCYMFSVTTAPKFWMFVIINLITLLIFLGLFGIFLIFVCITCCGVAYINCCQSNKLTQNDDLPSYNKV